MPMSLNTDNDQKLLELAEAARKIGADVMLSTSETLGSTGTNRTLTIFWVTHSPVAKHSVS